MGIKKYVDYVYVRTPLILILVTMGMGFFIYFCKRSKTDSGYYQPIPLATHSNGQNYMGSQSCSECHFDIYQSHIKTAHYTTSALADTSSIKGSFENRKNRYRLNDDFSFEMTLVNNEAFQEVRSKTEGRKNSKSKIDVVIGSGTKGQSYLNWSNDSLYQLQVSYYTPIDSWANSPGMSSEILSRPRPVNAKCMECHTTFAKNIALYGMGNKYDKEQIIYGIDCERCHGPSEAHVVFHKNNRTIEEPKYILNYDALSRRQRLDACALCHSGVRRDARPAFEFMAGDRLLDYSLPDPNTDSLKKIDVHGNQYGLLTKSKCFLETETMDCSTCHDPHKNQRGNTVYFNGKCIECHDGNHQRCSADLALIAEKGNNCIGCHMPLRPSKSMFMNRSKDTVNTAVMVRTHLIDSYIEKLE